MSSELDDISFKLGELTSQIRGLAEAQATAREESREAIEQSNVHRAEVRESLQRLNARAADIEAKLGPICAEVTTMKPQVAELMVFKARMGAVVAIAASMMTGALWLAWQGVQAFGAEIKQLVGRVFH